MELLGSKTELLERQNELLDAHFERKDDFMPEFAAFPLMRKHERPKMHAVFKMR